jgi:PBSX family phage terminase large subunit
MPLVNGKFEPLRIPEKHAKVLFDTSKKWRYRALWGGRNGYKDHSIAKSQVEMGVRKPIRTLFTREVQATIDSSIKQLLEDQIKLLGYSDYYKILKTEIIGINGTSFKFKGIKDTNSDDVKSFEQLDYVVICEGESFSKKSFTDVDPTVRKPGSEIWIQFNPDASDDFIYDFCVTNPSDNLIGVEVNYDDYPDLCSPEILEQAERCKRNNPDDYEHIWKGQPSNIGSKIYPDFCDDHIRNFRLDKIKDIAMFFCGQDPATVYYPFVVWMARIAKGDNEFDYWIYNEFPTLSMMGGKFFHEIRKEKVCSITLKQRSTMFKVLDNTIDRTYPWINIKARGIDTRFAKASGAASTTLGGTSGLIQTMSDPGNGGMAWETPPERLIDCQRDNIRKLMEFDKDLGIIPGVNEPHIYVAPHCYNVIDAFKHHRVNKTKGCEDEKRKDPIDAIRICMATMAQYDHVIKSIEEEVVTKNVDRAQELVDTWLKR